MRHTVFTVWSLTNQPVNTRLHLVVKATEYYGDVFSSFYCNPIIWIKRVVFLYISILFIPVWIFGSPSSDLYYPTIWGYYLVLKMTHHRVTQTGKPIKSAYPGRRHHLLETFNDWSFNPTSLYILESMCYFQRVTFPLPLFPIIFSSNISFKCWQKTPFFGGFTKVGTKVFLRKNSFDWFNYQIEQERLSRERCQMGENGLF